MAEIATTRLALPDLEIALDVPRYSRWAHEVLEERVDYERLERVDLYATRLGDILHVLKCSMTPLQESDRTSFPSVLPMLSRTANSRS